MQNRRSILFLGLALLLGLAAALMARNWAREQIPMAPQARVETTPVVVARADLAVGAALDNAQLELVDWPKSYLPTGALSEKGHLQGRVVRRPLAAGEPVLEPSLFPEGARAGLVSLIGDNRRAVSVKVDPVIGVAGFVTPGARVDVLATLRIAERAGQAQSKVILQNVPVLAIDQKMEADAKGKPELVSVVTLEVDPGQAEKLIYSTHEGRLQLALRNPRDGELVETHSVSASDLLSGPAAAAGQARPASRPRTTVQVIRGSRVTTQAF